MDLIENMKDILKITASNLKKIKEDDEIVHADEQDELKQMLS